jgi:hypothetical protein
MPEETFERFIAETKAKADEWISNERIITLRKARRKYPCAKCPEPIEEGSPYYTLVATGSGVGGRKDADRMHIRCLERKYREQ